MAAEDLNDRKIPCTMSTQHPDNVAVPDWVNGDVIDGFAEVHEAYHVYGTLGCQEVMWDAEGKDADTRVVRKLLEQHWSYFQNQVIGEDVFLTYRIPNPRIEVVEKKVVVETLQNIPMAFDAASSFYKRAVTPIFEVILPFTTDGNELIWLFNYYKKAVVANEEISLEGNIKAKNWVGSTYPKAINVIPLVEDFDSIVSVDRIVQPYLDAVKPKSMRVFIARSDPALNYGLLNAVLLSKIAISKLKAIETQQGVAVHPIIGVGSKPFRGHLAPDNLDKFLQEYRGISTVTVQSAARYDYNVDQVKQFVRELNLRLPNGQPELVPLEEEEKMLKLMWKCRRQYESIVEALAPLINSVASYVPQRRARKLHIGLFGYSRNIGAASLPRAITFAAALYSIGLPPEFIGSKALEDLDEEEWSLLRKHYVNMKHDFRSVGGYVSWENLNMLLEMHEKAAEKANMGVDKLEIALTKILEDLKIVEDKLAVKLGPRTPVQRRHANFTNNFLISYLEGEGEDEGVEDLIEAAKLRKCLG